MKPIAGRTIFLTAWGFFSVATAIGLLLRIHVLWPIPGMNYTFVLHAHSHTAFLGWIYNGFFALALQVFVRPQERWRFARLFLVTQISTVGMLVTFPFQGYARESILFSSLHVICSAVFAWKLMRANQAGAAARCALAWAFGFLFLSALGPIALGPMGAADLRGTPWYSMAIYFYLHFQYNGWFVFFLLAVACQSYRTIGYDSPVSAKRAVCSIHWLAAGCLLTLSQSAFWMDPPAWVHAAGMAGAVLQIAGCVGLWRAACKRPLPFTQRISLWLGRAGAAAFALKVLLQFLVGWPAFAGFASQRMAAVGFLHLVFLAVVTPALIAAAVEYGWMPLRGAGKAGLLSLSAGTVATEAILFFSAAAGSFPWVHPLSRAPQALAAAGALILLGVLLLAPSLRTLPARDGPHDAHSDW